MFIGHYGVALAAKRADKDISLGATFLLTEFLDIIMTIFVFFGLEKISFDPGTAGPSALNMVFPYSHSLAGSIIWSVLIFLLYRFYFAKSNARAGRIALIMGLVVFSHWVLDIAVHISDMSLIFGIDPASHGFGLWDYPVFAAILEAIILISGGYIYLRSTEGTTFSGKYGMIILLIIMTAINFISLILPHDILNNILSIPVSPSFFMAYLFSYFLLFAGAGFWLDKKRS